MSPREEPGRGDATVPLPVVGVDDGEPRSSADPDPDLRRAVTLMSASSVLVPLAGVVTQPLLAQGLGVTGRGELAAALAPSYLMLAVATLGLPDALTYYLARNSAVTRPALGIAAAWTIALGLLSVLVVFVFLPQLSVGDPRLGAFVLLAAALTVPALVVNALRGAASGRQMWGAVAAERLIVTTARVVLFVALFFSGHLSVFTAVLVSTLVPIVAGLVYWRLLLAPPGATDRSDKPVGRSLITYGGQVWLGSVASMLLSRLDQLLMAPLSTLDQLGLYSVAVTVSDLPLIVALAVAGALIGVNSRTNDIAQATTASRMTILLGFIGCVLLGLIVPIIIEPFFGAGFRGAIAPSQLLVFSAFLCIPGLMASASLSARGRPGIRSVGLALTLVVNLSVFVVLVPRLGAMGGACASVVGNVVMSTFMVIMAARVSDARPRDFVLVRASDMVRLVSEGRRLARRVFRWRRPS